MTPYELHIALHYHTRGCDLSDDEVADTPLRHETMGKFIAYGMLKVSTSEGQSFEATQKLHAFCEMLQSVPLPIECWVDPRGDKIIKRFVPTAGEL